MDLVDIPARPEAPVDPVASLPGVLPGLGVVETNCKAPAISKERAAAMRTPPRLTVWSSG